MLQFEERNNSAVIAERTTTMQRKLSRPTYLVSDAGCDLRATVQSIGLKEPSRLGERLRNHGHVLFHLRDAQPERISEIAMLGLTSTWKP